MTVCPKQKAILSLFDLTGNWSRPYREKGYEVVQIDLQSGTDIMTWDYRAYPRIYFTGVLAAVPCTDFSLSGARWFKEKDGNGQTYESMALVYKTLAIIQWFLPGLKWWAIENPMSRIHKLCPELEQVRLSFDPYQFAGYDPIPAQPDTIFINFSITNVGCNDSAGSVTVTAITNATPYYSYRWSYGSDTTHVLANIGAGSYVVTITDANQCSASASATVSSADSISLQSVNLRVNNVCGGLTDSVEISATGLSASSYTIHYTLTYPDSLTSHDSATLHYNSGVYVFTIPTTLLDTPGLFKVTINSISFSSGCTGTLTTGISQTFWVYPSCATSLSLSPDSSVFCPGHTFILQSIPSGTTGIYSGTSYTWSINGIMDVDALHNIHPTFTAPSTGTYTYSVSCVTAYGCHGSDSTTIHVDSISAMVTPADPSVCVWGNSITLTAPLPPSGSGYSYHWSNSNTSRSITVTPTTSIGYTVIVSDSHCTDSMHVVVALDTFTVFVNPTDASSCAGGQVTFNASSSHPISSYLWSNASITNTATYTLSHTGSFTVTATDANGCHDTASVMATVDSPAVDISYILCNGGIATANVSHDAGGATYQWNTGGAADTISNFSAGTYSVTVTDQLYCTASDSVSIPQPHSHLLLNGVIHYSTCHNNDSILVEVSGGTAPYFYHWNIGSTTPNLINISPGTYSVTVTDSALCSGNATYIVLPPFPVTIISGTGTTLCTPGFDTLTASATGGVSPYTYLWSTGDTTQSSAIAYTDGLFTVTVTDASGCSNKDSITLNVFSNAITNENFYQCYTNDGFTANLFFYDPNDTTVKFEGTPPYTFHWSSGTVTNPTQVPGNPYEYNISISTPGTYVLSITDAAGCEIAREIEVYSQSHFHFSDSTSVLNCSTTIYLGVTGGVTGGSYNYSWSDGENGSGVSSITVYVPGTYIVTVTDATNCTASDSILVSPYESYACCFANTGATIIPLVTDTVWSDTLHISPGSSIYVGANVKLIVDSTLTLQSCEVVLGTNAQIIVEATDTLNLLGDILHGCDTMWNGIFVNFRGAINVDEYDSVYSIIEDAMSGVVVEGELDDSKAMFRHTKFNRNQTSISFVDYAPEANNICDVSDCYFGMGMYTSMLPAPARHTNYKRPVTGIAVVWGDLLDMTMPIPVVSLPNPVIGGGANTFQYVNCGVSAINCPLNLYANTFDSIRNFEGASGFNYGAAVAGSWVAGGGSRPQPNFGNLTVQTASSTPDSLSTIFFNNCDYGIKVSSITLSATNNRMENVTYGIYTKTASRTVTASNNYIHNTSYGVSLLNNSSANQTVSGNTLYVNPPTIEWVPTDTIITIGLRGGTIIAYRLGDLQTYGIEETEVTGSSTLIYGNAIWNGLNCIVLTNAKGTRVESNGLHQMDNTAVFGQRAGLYASSCSGIYVSSNTCYSDTNYYEGIPNVETYVNLFGNTGPYVYRKSGLAFYNTYNGTVCNNTLGGTTNGSVGIGYGMLFSSFCDGLGVHANTMNQSYYGTTLQSSGVSQILGNQGGLLESHDNSFAGNGSGEFAGGYRNYSFINIRSDSGVYLPPTFYYNTGQPLTNPDTGDALINDTIRFADRIQPQPTVGADIFPYLCFDYVPIPFPYPIHKIGLLDSIIAQNNTKNYMEPGFDSTATWLPSKILYESLYSADSTILADSLMNAFYTNENDSDVSIILLSELQNQSLTDSATLADTVSYDGKASGYADALSNASTYNNNIPTTNKQAANYVAMSNIYLETAIAGIDTFTTGQLDTIMSLAVQCPYLAGDAVYMARSLYAQYDNTIYFDDLAICTPPSDRFDRALRVPNNALPDTSAKTSALTDYIIVYPNPAKNNLKVFYSSESSTPVTFELTDLMGQPIISKPVTGMTTIELDISNIASGLYLWRGRNGSLIVQTGKVSVQK